MSDKSKRTDPREVRRRSLSGVRWTVGKTVVVALVGPLAQVVKARFLTPTELGTVAVLMLVYGFVHTIENAGLEQTIVQKPELDSSDRFTYLSIAIALGIVGSLVLFLTAGFIERVFGVPGSRHLLMIAGPLLFFAVVDQYLRALLHRDLEFRGVAVVESAKKGINVALLMVLLGAGLGPASVAYALLISTVTGALALFAVVLRHGLIHVEPRFNRMAFRQLGGFGLPIAAKKVFSYFTHRADELVVALALSPETLGIYHLAKETLDKLRNLITSSYSRILLPMFSRVRDNVERLTYAYERITLVVAYIGISAFAGLAITAPRVVPVVFGSQWIAAVPAFQAFSIALIPIVLTANISSSLLYALGKAANVLIADIAVNVPYLVVLYALRGANLSAILASYVIYCFAKALVLQAMAISHLSVSAVAYGRIYIRVAVRVIAMIVIVLVVGAMISTELRAAVQAAVIVGIGSLAMVAIIYATDKEAVRQIAALVGATR